MRVRSGAVRRTVCAAVLALLAGGATVGSAAASTSAPAVARLALDSNVAPQVDYYGTCSADATSSACTSVLVTDIDHARSLEGVGPLVLPDDWAQLSSAQQTFVLINLERVDRGLPPVAGITDDLNAIAAGAAAADTDPALSAGAMSDYDPWWWTGVWAMVVNPLAADYLWMYQDGWDGSDTTNVDCTSATADGCWGHRKNILSDYAGAPELVAGVGQASGWGASVAEIVVGGDGVVPPLTYTWRTAVMHGAGGSHAMAAFAPARVTTTAVHSPTKAVVSKRAHHRHAAHRRNKRQRRR